jgi:selT/selW/selH-like putative selenoprotein
VKQQRPGIDVKFIRGSGGQFEVVLDGKLIFSKKQMGRFPDAAEIVELIPAA